MSGNIYFNSMEKIEQKLNYELNCFSSHISGAELSDINPSEVLKRVLPYIGYVANKANSMNTLHISGKTYRQVVEYFISLFVDKKGLSEAYKDAYTDPMRDYFCDTKYISDFNNKDKNYSPDNTYLVLGLMWIFEKLVVSDNCKKFECLPLYTVHDSFDNNILKQKNFNRLFPTFIKSGVNYETNELDLYALDYWGINKEELAEILERRSQTGDIYDEEDKKNANNLNWALILEPHYLLSRYKRIINLNPRQWNKDANSERMKLILLIYCFEKNFQINHIRSFKGINDRNKSMGDGNMYSEFINIPLLISDCNNHFSNTFDPTHTNSDIYDSLMYHVSLGVDIGHVCAYAQMMLQVSLYYNSIISTITETIRKLISEYRAANDEDCSDNPVKIESIEKYIARLSDIEIDEKYNSGNSDFVRSHPFHCFYSFLKINQFLASIGVNFVGSKKQKHIIEDGENVLRKKVLAVIGNTDFSGFEDIEIILPQGEKSGITNIRDELNGITLKPLSEIEFAGRKITMGDSTQNLSENQIEYTDYIERKAKLIIKHIPDYEDNANSYNKILKRELEDRNILTIITSVMKGDVIIRSAISPLDFYICFVIRCNLKGISSKEPPYYFNNKKEKQKLISRIASRRVYSEDEAMLIRIFEDAKNTASGCYNKAHNDYLNEAIQRGQYIVNDKIRRIAGISDNQNENNDVEKFYANIKKFSQNVADL